MGYYNSYEKNGIIYCDQTYPPIIAPIDSERRTVCYTLQLLDCGVSGNDCPLAVINNGQILCAVDQSWNCKLCANDLPYFNPVVAGDILDFQFQQIDDWNGIDPNVAGFGSLGWGVVVDGFVKECCSDEYIMDGGSPKSIVNYALKKFVGVFNDKYYNGTDNYKSMQQIRLDVDAILADLTAQFPNSNCFYLEFIFYSSTGATPVYLYSEPYKVARCKDTVLIEAYYGNKDCFGYWTNDDIIGDTAVSDIYAYNNHLRIPAKLEAANFSISKEYVGTYQRTVSNEIIENSILYTNRIPYKVTRQMVDLLSATEVYIDNTQYIVDGEIEKNNDMGSQWFCEVPLRKITCSKSSGCN